MKKRIAAIVIFIFFLVAPTITWIFVQKYDPVELFENREKAPAPTFGNGFFNEFNAYYNDRAPYRNILIAANGEIELVANNAYVNILRLLGIPYYTAINNVIIGQDDWLFYLKQDSLKYYKGTNLPSESDLSAYLERAKKVSDYFAAQGKQFAIFVTPNKEQIYSEFMPSAIKVENEVKRLDIITSYLKAGGVNIVYPKEEILAHKDMGLLYLKQDTHWNSAGAYYGAVPLFESLGRTLSAPVFNETTASGGDLKNITNVDNVDYQSFSIVYKSEITSTINNPTDYEFYSSSNINNGENLVLLGDSFRKTLYDVFSKEYDNTLINHYDTFDKDTSYKEAFENATTVIFQVTERYDPKMFAAGGVLDRFIEYFIEND